LLHSIRPCMSALAVMLLVWGREGRGLAPYAGLG
jgi:hypothetical protein